MRPRGHAETEAAAPEADLRSQLPEAGNGAAPRRRGPYAKTEARRLEILAAAAEAFSQAGYAAASLREIADHLGLTHAAITFHFRTKADLLAAVLEQQENAFHDVLDHAAERPMDFLALVVRLFRERVSVPGRTELFLMLAAESSSAEHPAHEYVTYRYGRVRDATTAVFAELGKTGLLRRGLDAAEVARHAIALVDGLQLQWLYAPELDVPADLESYFGQVLTAQGRRALESRLV